MMIEATTPHGYFARYLTIDLKEGRHAGRPLPLALLRQVIGGSGLGTALLMHHTEAGYDPLGPNAAVVFASGPLSGTALTTTAKVAVVCKSPLTHRLNDALTSSDFALACKATGFDAIVLSGRCAEPSILLIDHGDVVFRPVVSTKTPEVPAVADIADDFTRLSGLYPGYHFAAIGLAGINGVPFAGLSASGRHAGRGGLGAVLGAMNVRAIGIRGGRRPSISDPAHLAKLSDSWSRRSLSRATAKYRKLGTVANVAAFNRLNLLPTENFGRGSIAGADALSGESLAQTHAAGRGSCRGCTIGCEHYFRRETGDGSRVRLEYETVFALGPLCGVVDPDVALQAAARCNALGLDTISCGATIAFAMDCNGRGLLGDYAHAAKQLELNFGNGQAVLRAIELIAAREGPMGQLLALGSRRMGEKLGGAASALSPQIKGLELPGYHPGGAPTLALGMAVSARGADHNKSGGYEVDFAPGQNRRELHPGKVALAVTTEDRAALFDSLILCKFLRGIFDDPFAEGADALTAVVGTTSREDLHAASQRITIIKRAFNEREGWARAEDDLPARFFRPADSSDPDDGLDRDNFVAMIKHYYQLRHLTTDGRCRPKALDSVRQMLSLLCPAQSEQTGEKQEAEPGIWPR